MKTSLPVVFISLLALVLVGPALRGAEAVPLFDGLGSHTFKITTTSPDAQRYFDQGLRFYYGFNHGSAIRSFQEAARLDPAAAMPHWGIALASGPHINFPLVPPPAAERAWKELGLARAAAPNASPVERDLIEALSHRYANPQPDDRSALDLAYANAMRAVWRTHSDNADVGVLFAEAMMDLRPWDQWTPEGQPQPGTDEILATLDAVLKLDLQHPFANHLYIHAVEASPHPERAIPAADRLRDLQPDLAHNVHMPSHIYIRCGRWDEAVTANVKAVEAAQRHTAKVGVPEGILVFYNAHNRHMLAYAAMMTGRSDLAIREIRTMTEEIPEATMKEYAMFGEAMIAMPYEVLLRFGRWDDVLAAPDHPDYLPFTRAFRHAARGIAFAAKGDVTAARAEQAAFRAAAKVIPPDDVLSNNTCRDIAGVADHMLAGEILFRAGEKDAGLAELREAVKREDALHYDEPPGWILPVRHALGASLLVAGKTAEAEQVYREDLRRLPGNGWSQFGLAEALTLQHRDAEAAALRDEFQKTWNHADVTIASSCFCQAGF